MGSEPGSNFQTQRPGVVDAEEVTEADIEKVKMKLQNRQDKSIHYIILFLSF